MSEVMRVLAPLGVAYIKNGTAWTKTVKPWPKGIDEWTHYLHDPSGNAVAHDTVVGPPRHMQWLAEPLFTRAHDQLDSISAIVSQGGRLFSIVDKDAIPVVGLVPKWTLVARDAFNGVWLWERPIGAWADIDRHFRSGPDQLPRLLVAVGGRVYAPLGFDQPVSALDAATGQTLKVFPETKGTEEIIVHEGVLLAIVGTPAAEQSLVGTEKSGKKKTVAVAPQHPAKTIVALRTDSGAVLWRYSEPTLKTLRTLTLAASGQRVFFTDGSGTMCVDLTTGRPLWRHNIPMLPPGPLGLSSATLVVRDGVVLIALPSAGKGKKGWLLTALSAEKGEKLWESPCGGGSFSPPDVLVAGGLVWIKGFDEGRDLRTGQIKKSSDVVDLLTTVGHHDRCYRNKATDRYLLLGHRGIECMDLVGDAHSRNNWVRGTCQYGILPCNGLIYAPSHSCGCYIEAMVHGFWALAPGRTADVARNADDARPLSNEERLERGAIPEAPVDIKTPPSPADWPTYRGNAARSGSTTTELPATLVPAWQVTIGGNLTAPVVAGGKVLVCSINEHRVVALDATQGHVLWSFIAGGRVDSSPTVWQDSVLFGSADGWVYCLRATDGNLRWRFLAAADERRTVALNQIESIWPVNGSVLIQDGLAYVAAGRSSYLDGGIRLYALDPRTGRVVHEKHVCNDHPTVHKTMPAGDLTALRRGQPDWPLSQNKVDARTYTDPDKSDAFSMDGATTDILVGDGQSVYLRQMRFDRDLAAQPQGSCHLYATSRLIDDAAAQRTHWLLGTGEMRPLGVSYEWSTRKLGGGSGQRCCTVPFGLMLAFDAQTAWGVTKSADELFAVQLRPPASGLAHDFQPPTKQNSLKWQWSGSLPVVARAMARAGSTVWVAGLTKTSVATDAKSRRKSPEALREALSGAGVLAAFSATDGKARGEIRLAASPVWDGMAVAQRSLYISTLEGKLLCLKGASK